MIRNFTDLPRLKKAWFGMPQFHIDTASSSVDALIRG